MSFTKVFTLIFCFVLILLSCYGAFICLDQAMKTYPGGEYDENLIEIRGRLFSRYALLGITHIGCIVFLVIFFANGIKKTNTSNSVRLTYEEYKTLRDAKKAERQQKKKEKLQKQLEKIEKAE